ncbi:MAG: ABC transporter permease subunit [Deinococcales bacterium]
MRPSWLSTALGVAASTFLAVFFLLPLATVALGLPGALLFARYDFAGKRFLTAAFTIPFVMPTVVAGIGFLALFGPRGLTGLNLRDTLALILLAHVFYNYAIVVRVVGGFLEGAAPRLLEAASTLGADAWRSTLRVSLPLALPALLASATLVFLFCFTSFGVILILAPSPHLATLEVEIYRLTAHLLELGHAAVLVVAQLVVVGLVTWLYTRMQARLAVALPARAEALPRPRGRSRVLLGVNLLVAGALILSPLGALAVQALEGPGGSFPSLANLVGAARPANVLGLASLGLALRNSLLFATTSTVIALIVGFAFAYAVARGRWRVLDQLSLLPLATSPVTLGFGYLLAFPLLVTHPWGIPLAHALIAFPFVARSLLPALRGLDPALAAAATTLGAGPGRVLWRVELPQLGSSLLTAASFAFAVSMGEFGATLLLVRPDYATLPVAIFDRLGRPGPQHYGAAMALALVLMVVTGAVMALLQRRGRSEF